MPKLQRSFRLDADLLEAIETYADTHKLSATAAIETLISKALEDVDAPTGAENAAVIELLKNNLEDKDAQIRDRDKQLEDKDGLIGLLKVNLDDLRGQLAVKDEQIATAQRLADQAQQLHAAAIAGNLPAPAEDAPEAVRDDETPEPITDNNYTQPQPKQGLWERFAALFKG